MKKNRSLLWTQCSIELLESDFFVWDIDKAFDIIVQFENNYSRFLKANILDELNTKKEIVSNKELHTLVRFWIQLWNISQWYFDISILPYLENNGYGISETYMKEDIWYQHIQVSDTKIRLNNNINIEFWAYGKGYMLDKVWYFLSQKYKNFILDFWGDIKVYGNRDIYLENPSKNNNYYGKIPVHNAALTSSNGSKRIFWDNSHHLIDIKTGKSHNKVHTVFCYHSRWMFADGFATLLSVTPKDLCTKIMKDIKWLEAFVIYNDGSELRSWRFINI